jgi:uncharacterized protein involved in exopolysaccharide biosynthesis
VNDFEIIDLNQIWKIVVRYKYRLVAIVAFSAVLGAGISFCQPQPKQYESTAMLRKNWQAVNESWLQNTLTIARFSISEASDSHLYYLEKMKSSDVLEPVIAQLNLPDKEKLDSVSFAKNNLKIQNIKESNLIEIRAIGRTPEEAQQIAAGVVDSFQQFIDKKKQANQLNINRIFEERIAAAQQELEQNQQKLDNFHSQQQSGKIGSGKNVNNIILEQKVDASRELYRDLFKKYEEFRIQNTVKSAEIEVVSQANLPKQPLASKKMPMALVGGLIGVMLSFVYGFVLYYREHSKLRNVS